MSVAPAVDALGGTPITLVREGAGTLVGGYWQAGATTNSTVLCSVQAPNGRDLQVLPDGQRADEVRVIFSTNVLRTREPGQWDPDALVFDGFTWRVKNVQTWTAFGGTYYRALVTKVTPAGSVGNATPAEAGDGVAGTGTHS